MVMSLTCCQRLGYSPRADDVPAPVLDHVRRCLELVEGTAPTRSARAASHRQLVRERLGVVPDPERARAHSSDLWIAASAIHIDASLVTPDEIFNGVAGLDVADRRSSPKAGWPSSARHRG